MTLSLRSAAPIALAAAALLTGCSPKSADADLGGSGPIKLDAFCTIQGLPPALRSTTIVVDTTSIVAAQPEEFRSRNPELLALIVGLADPAGALDSGAIAPRERVSILAASPRTGAVTPIFTGCVPGASSTELAALAQQGAGGVTQRYFGSDIASQVRKQQGDFTRQVLLALARLGKVAEPKAAASDGGFVTSPLVRALKPIGPPEADDPSVRRLFVYSDLSRSVPGAEAGEARAAGFKAAQEAGVRLGLAELHLVSPGATLEDAGQQFLDAFALGSQARLEHVGGFSANGLKPAPSQVVNYRGSLIATESLSMPMTLRLAATRDGQLVNSWISYTASLGQRSTPVNGQFTCSAERTCILRSDPAGGLGQLWRIKLGPEPEVREDAPLGGLRFVEATETARSLKGRVYDPVISIGRPGGGMTFEASRTKE